MALEDDVAPVVMSVFSGTGSSLAAEDHERPATMSKMSEVNKGATSAINDGWVSGGGFLGSILAGVLLGWGLDTWLGTDPWLIVTGIVLGSIAGFYRMWAELTTATTGGKQDIFDGK